MKKLTKKEYESMVKEASTPVRWANNMFFAFLFGGTICTIGQLLFFLFNDQMKMGEKEARILVSVLLIGFGALLTILGLFDNVAKIAGAGTLVPITGFANSIVSPAIEFKSEGFIMGVSAKMFVIAGPVLVFGITASVIYGLIVFFLSLS